MTEFDSSRSLPSTTHPDLAEPNGVITGKRFAQSRIPEFYAILHAKAPVAEHTRSRLMHYYDWSSASLIQESYRIEDDSLSYFVTYDAYGKINKNLMISRQTPGISEDVADPNLAIVIMSTYSNPLLMTNNTSEEDYLITYHGPTETDDFTVFKNSPEAEDYVSRMLVELKAFNPVRYIQL